MQNRLKGLPWSVIPMLAGKRTISTAYAIAVGVALGWPALALALIASFAISSPVRAQIITEYTLTNRPDTMLPIPGSDGNIWFGAGGAFSSATTAGAVVDHSANEMSQNNAGIVGMHGITIGPDGGMWSFNSANCNLDTIAGVTGAIGVTQFNQNCGFLVPEFGEIVKGPDGFLWYTTAFGIRRMDVSGNYITFPLTGNGGNDTPIAIVVGGDSALWATSFARLIYRLTTSGTMTFYTIPWSAAGGCVALVDIALGPDDEVWFTDACANSIGRITRQGVFTQFVVPNGGFPRGIINGPDNALYFTDSANNAIGRLGAGGVFSFYPIATPGSTPWGIAVGPDQNIWFTENTGPNFDTRSPGKLGKLDIHPLRTKRNETHDFDGDGYSDIAWRDSSGNGAIWLMNGATVASTGGLGTVPNTWSIVAQRDFDGDGKYDLLWRDTSGNTAIWFMNGISVSSAAGLGNIPIVWTVVATADFDGDGHSDILWRDSSGNLAMWLMNGATVVSSGGVGNVPLTWSIVGTSDYDGDGKADLLWRDTSGNTAMWFMNGRTVSSSGGLGNIPSVWSVVGTGDFDGDGHSDILWQDTSGNLAMWLMNGATVVSAGGLGNVPTVWSVVATGDYDGDGRSDLLWRDTSGNTAIWFMNGATVASTGGLGNIPTVWTVQSVNAE